MKYLNLSLFSFFIVLHFIACNESKDADDKSKSDSIFKTDYNDRDTLQGIASNEDAMESENLNDIKTKYINSYKDTLTFDTSVKFNGEIIKVQFKHSCLFDSSLEIPEKYIASYNLKQFVTHNFQSNLKVLANEKVVLDTIINKNTFEHILPDELKKYGALLYPNVTALQDRLVIDYSITIPLTDVGGSYSLLCDYYGNIKIQK